MPRTLPWATRPIKYEGQLEAVSHADIKPEQEQMMSEEEVINNGAPNSRLVTPPSKLARRPGSRAPSSSPPPAQPEIGLMHEGYEADDAYMMVEDEFYSVAQAFTAHLHHAEYKRLMRKAQNSTPKPLPELSSSMSSDVKQKLQRAQLDRKQKAALGGIGANARSIGGDDDLVDEPRVDDPWSGTSLAGLMSTGSQHRTSLIGLEGMPSTTRAAKGYTKGQTAGRSPDIQRKQKSSTAARDKYHSRGPMSLSDAAGDDDDARNPKRQKIEPDDEPLKRSDRSRGSVHMNPPEAEARRTWRMKPSFIDDLEDDLLEPFYDPPSPPRRPKPLTPIKAKRKPEDKKKDRRSRLDEVPVFMTS